MGFSVRGLAARQLADYRAGTPGSFFGEEDQPRLALDDAYAVQAEVARLRVAEGEPVAGYKVGATGPGTRKQFGMDGPVRGFVYEAELYPSGTTLSYASYANLAAGMATSGALTGWLKKISGDVSYETLTEEAAAVPQAPMRSSCCRTSPASGRRCRTRGPAA